MIENFLEFHGCFPALPRLQVRLTAHIGGIESSELGNVGMNQQCVAWEAGKFVLFPVGGGQGATTFGSHLASPARTAFPSLEMIAERSSPSRVRCAAPNNGAPLTAPGRS
jgi:hypothetical protein